MQRKRIIIKGTNGITIIKLLKFDTLLHNLKQGIKKIALDINISSMLNILKRK